MSGLFSTFGIATRGLEVQQKAIDVTSHNIANANTEGYSRQRATIETTRPSGMPSLNSQSGPGQLGTGAQISAIERVRDTFLDYQVRVETSTLGEYQAKDKFLSEVESILNEPSDTGISKLLGNYFNSWQTLSGDPNNSNTRTVVAQNAASLADALNHTSDQLDKLKTNSQSIISDTVFQANNYLDQLDKINQQIMSVKIAGNQPNDLEDKRDLLLDKLSSEFGISIDKKEFDGNDVSPITTKAASPFDTITTPPSDNSIIKAENSSDVKRISYFNIARDTTDSTKATLTYYKKGDMTDSTSAVTINLTGLDDNSYNFLDQSRVLWADNNGNAIDGSGNAITASTIDCSDMTKVPLRVFNPSSGEIQGYMSVQKDITDYQGQLNNLAKTIALSTNILHSGETDSASDDLPFFVNSETGGLENNINAKNISVNSAILNDVMKIKAGKDSDPTSSSYSGATDGSRALAIASLRDSLLKIGDVTDTSTRTEFEANNSYDSATMKLNNNSSGTKIDNYFKDIIDKLGIQEQKAKTTVANQESLLDSFSQTRDSVSGVSLDEEMANMVQYQHAYQANAKIISVLDELLDVVVNGLKK